MSLRVVERATAHGRLVMILGALCAASMSCAAAPDGTAVAASADHGDAAGQGNVTDAMAIGESVPAKGAPDPDAGETGTASVSPPAQADADPAARGRDGDASDVVPGGCGGLFCEDFESGKLAPGVWNLQASGGQTVEVQKDVAAHGHYAVKFHALPNVVSYDFIITKNAPAALGGHHFGRAYFRTTPKPPQQHTEFLFAGSAGFPKLKYLEVAETGLNWQMTFVSRVAPMGETYGFGSAVPLDDWACLEWEMSDSPDSITVFVDGAQVSAFDHIAFNGASTALVGGFVDFGFGFYAWHPATYAFDVYYDDIVLDTKRIGCL